MNCALKETRPRAGSLYDSPRLPGGGEPEIATKRPVVPHDFRDEWEFGGRSSQGKEFQEEGIAYAKTPHLFVRERFSPSSWLLECECVLQWEGLLLWVSDDQWRQLQPRDRVGKGADRRQRPSPALRPPSFQPA